MTLAAEVRPRRFADVVGHGPARAVLRAAVRSGQVPPLLAFVGPPGVGKTTMAEALTRALNCAASVEGDACLDCPACGEVDWLLIRPDSFHATSQASAPGGRRWRVLIAPSAHLAAEAEWASLLLGLEDPAERNVHVLETTEPERLPEEVLSRALVFEFGSLSTREIAERVWAIAQDRTLDVGSALVAELAWRAEGDLRRALTLLERCVYAGVGTREEFRQHMGERSAEALFEAAMAGNHLRGQELIEEEFGEHGDARSLTRKLTELVRDLLVVKAGGELTRMAPDEVELRKKLAGRLAVGHLIAAIRVLWELKSRTRYADGNQRMEMEMGFTMLAEALHPTPIEPIPRTAVETRRAADERLTLAQMQAMVAEEEAGR